VPRLLPRKTVKIVAGPPVDLSEVAGQAPTSQVLRAMTARIMRDVADLLGQLRGETPPAEPYHPAVARRQLREDLRALQESTAAQDDTLLQERNLLQESTVSDSSEGSIKP
jgi:phosphoenolpyruvate carboxylase